jgi:hypothetical protein
MINEEVLTEKLKYLIMMASRPKFEILQFGLDFEYDNHEKRKILMYTVDVKFDYTGRIDGTPSEIGSDIERMMSIMSSHIGTYFITPEGKISQDYDAYVDEGVIWVIEFEFDMKHNFDTSFKVTYSDNL